MVKTSPAVIGKPQKQIWETENVTGNLIETRQRLSGHTVTGVPGEADRDFSSLSLFFCVCATLYGELQAFLELWAGPNYLVMSHHGPR